MGSATKPVVGRFIGSHWDVEWLGVCRTFPHTKPPHFPLLAGVREFPDLDSEGSGSMVVMGPGLWHKGAAETSEGQGR